MPPRDDEIIALLKKGMHPKEISEKVNLSERRIRNIRDQAGLSDISPEILSRDLEITNLYDSGEKVDEIAKAFNIAIHTTREIIKRIKRGGYGGYPRDPQFTLHNGKDERPANKKLSKRSDAELVMKYQGDLISLQNQYEGLLETYRKMESRYRDEIAALGRLLADLEMKHAEEMEAAQ
jgi:transposase